MTQITLQATYSALAQPDEVSALNLNPPVGWRLSAHQVATYRALRTSQPGGIVFNTAFTGDGKSLGGQLADLRGSPGIPKSLLMFPTKELARDQLGQLERNLKLWRPGEDIYPRLLDADELDVQSERRDLSRSETLQSVLWDGDFVLTNPDILHYIMQAAYVRRKAEAPDRVIAPLVNAFSQFTFDEFHIFESPQIVAVTNALLLIRELAGARCPRFLFLSATPSDAMLQFLDRAGVPFQEIKGQYAHDRPPNAHEWRLILREARLTVQAMTVTEWIDAHLEDTLLRFFREQGKHAKGAIIVNSVATAQGLYQRLKPSCDRQGIRLALNTGFDSKKARQRSYDADLLIGTSTIDVGVDFKINFLLFESRDAGTFLQRLGRLGRHSEFERASEKLVFNAFEAHALVPEWVHTALFEGRDGQPRMLAESESVDREVFANYIKVAFPSSNPFNSYGKRWGSLQAAHICMFLASPLIRDTYAVTRKNLIEKYERTLDIRINAECGRLNALRKENPPLVDEALSFRGSSWFECGVIDVRLPDGELRAKRYDLLWLLSNTHIELIDKQTFERTARREGWNETTLKRFEPIAYCNCLSLRDERLNVEFLVGHDLQTYEADWFHTAQVLDRIEITTNDVPGVNTINRTLRQLDLPVLLSTFNPHELRRRMRLPPLFQLYAMRGRGDNVMGTIAFGRQALMLDSILRGRRDLLPPQTAIIA